MAVGAAHMPLAAFIGCHYAISLIISAIATIRHVTITVTEMIIDAIGHYADVTPYATPLLAPLQYAIS